jgi:hypothetical protein
MEGAGIIRISFVEGEPVDLPGSFESIHVFHSITIPWKPIVVKFTAPQPNLIKELSVGHARFLGLCKRLASDAVTQQVNLQKLGLACFSCGSVAVGFEFWNFIYAETVETLKWVNYAACHCGSNHCLKALDGRFKAWVSTGKNKVYTIE